MSEPRERWILTVDLPAGIANPGRFMAMVLKHLLRCWGVRVKAIGVEAEVKRLQGIVASLADRCARQA